MWISYALHNIHIQFIYYWLVLTSERGLSEFFMHTNMFNISTYKHTKCFKYKMNKCNRECQGVWHSRIVSLHDIATCTEIKTCYSVCMYAVCSAVKFYIAIGGIFGKCRSSFIHAPSDGRWVGVPITGGKQPLGWGGHLRGWGFLNRLKRWRHFSVCLVNLNKLLQINQWSLLCKRSFFYPQLLLPWSWSHDTSDNRCDCHHLWYQVSGTLCGVMTIFPVVPRVGVLLVSPLQILHWYVWFLWMEEGPCT